MAMGSSQEVTQLVDQREIVVSTLQYQARADRDPPEEESTPRWEQLPTQDWI